MTTWQGDFKKDMLTYRAIELSVSLVEALFQDKETEFKYREWLSIQNNDVSSAITLHQQSSALLAEINPEQDSSLKVIALPAENNFAVEARTPAFAFTAHIVYSFENFDIVAAMILSFEGDETLAVAWTESLLVRLDDMRLGLAD